MHRVFFLFFFIFINVGIHLGFMLILGTSGVAISSEIAEITEIRLLKKIPSEAKFLLSVPVQTLFSVVLGIESKSIPKEERACNFYISCSNRFVFFFCCLFLNKMCKNFCTSLSNKHSNYRKYSMLNLKKW